MTLASKWIRQDPEFYRLLAEETVLAEATELVSECLDRREITRSELAQRLNVTRSEVTQRLSGKRNLSVRTLGSMLHELGYRLHLGVEDLTVHRSAPRSFRAADTPWNEALPHYTNTGSTLTVVKASA